MLGHYFDRIDSTNAFAVRTLREQPGGEPFFVLAREQSQGRGTHDRRWQSPRGAGVYLSLAESCPQIRPVDLVWIAPAVGVACAEALRTLLRVDVQLKPVNDLYLAGGKLGGVLKQSETSGERVAWLVIGIGLNTRRAERPMPAGSPPAACLEDFVPPDLLRQACGPDARSISAKECDAGEPITLDDPRVPPLVQAIVESVIEWKQHLAQGDLPRLRQAYRDRLIPGSTWPRELSET